MVYKLQETTDVNCRQKWSKNGALESTYFVVKRAGYASLNSDFLSLIGWLDPSNGRTFITKPHDDLISG